MPALIAVRYGSAAEAERAANALHDLDAADELDLKDVAVVVNRDGEVELHQHRQLAAGEAAVGGGTIGLLLGVPLGFPLAIALAGLAAGGGLSFLDRGIPDGRMRDEGAELAPGEAALFALVPEDARTFAAERLGPYGGVVVAADGAAAP